MPEHQHLLEPEGEGYLDKPYLGPLPEGHDGEWLPGEESADQPLLLWHLSYPKGKGLAKARVGPPVSRPVAEGLVAPCWPVSVR